MTDGTASAGIAPIPPGGLPAALSGLAAVLVDAVAGGASVNFMAGFSEPEARAWWAALQPAVDAGRSVLFTAAVEGRIVGTVILGLDVPPNQPHRGEIRKLLVLREARRRGVARRLMEAAEAEAVRRGLTLLTLDTMRGGAAEALYLSLGYAVTGIVPGYALFPDGRPGDTTFFHKVLSASPGGS